MVPRSARTIVVAGALGAMVAGVSGAGAAAGWPERLEGHGGPVRGIVLSDDGAALSGSFDYTVVHWRLEDGRAEAVRRMVGHDAAVNDVAFVPASALAVSASDDGTVGMWDLQAGGLVARLEGSGDKILDVDVSADGRLVAAAGWDRTARVWDIARREELATMRGHDDYVNAVAFSPDAERLYTASADGDIRMWDVATGQPLRRVLRHGWGVNVLRLVAGGDMLLFGAVDGSAGVVDVESGEVVRELGQHRGPVLSAAVSEAAGLAALGGAEGELRVYRLADWTMQHDHANPYGPVWAAAITPDGRMIYYAGLDDFVIGLQLDPRQPFEPAEGVFPRRFQMTEDMDPGERQFARKCSVCHTLTPDDGNRAGPTLYRVFGREAGSLPGYPYSEALRESDIVWNEETIAELFDHGPDVVTPGTKMPIQRLRDEDDRDALVAFLKRATQ